MEAVPFVRNLFAQGRFSDALLELERLPQARIRTLEVETFRVELLERTGRYAEAEALAHRLLKGRALSGQQRSVCEFSLGLIVWDRGQTHQAIEHFQRAVAQAESSGDLWRLCWAQLR